MPARGMVLFVKFQVDVITEFVVMSSKEKRAWQYRKGTCPTRWPPRDRRDATPGVRPFVVTYKGRSKTVELPGYYLENSDEGIHVGDDMAATDAALKA